MFLKRFFSKLSSVLSPFGQDQQHKLHRINAQNLGINTFISSSALAVVNTLQKKGFEAFLVGGCVRDLLLGKKVKDFDVATNARPQQITRLFRRAFIIGKRFPIVHVRYGQDIIEVTTFRGCQSGRLHTDANGLILKDNEFGSQSEDSLRRDFTVNALYYDPCKKVILDFLGGWQDLKSRKLKIIGQPALRLREDPVRIIRALRFSVRLQLEIDSKLQSKMVNMVPLIKNVSTARLTNEMIKILLSGHAIATMEKLYSIGITGEIIPLISFLNIKQNPHPMISQVLLKTDQRVESRQSVSLSFLFSCLLWPTLSALFGVWRTKTNRIASAFHLAVEEIDQLDYAQIGISKKLMGHMRDIWMIQLKMSIPENCNVHSILAHPALRMGYDFLILRNEIKEVPLDVVLFWRDVMAASIEERDAIISLRKQKNVNHGRRTNTKK